MMTGKQRVHAALEGKPVDRFPVTVPYAMLYQRDHFHELTGLPAWHVHKWVHADPADHVRILAAMLDQAPFELVQPIFDAPSHFTRENTEFVERDGRIYCHLKKEDLWKPITNISGHDRDYRANETQYVFSVADVREQVKLESAEQRMRRGANDYIEAAVGRFGRESFILSGGVIGIPYQCHSFVGLTNLYALMAEQPDLIDYLSQRILENTIEEIRRLADAGGDAIYIDDAMTTCDMISVAYYERFSLPYMKAMVREIHRLNHKAIVIYFGGIADRLDQIAAIGADGLIMETSMKNYVNDIETTADRIGTRISLCGNIDPIRVLQDGTEAELERELARQAAAGRRARGFVMSTGSPITPATPLSRVCAYIERSKRS